MTAGALRTPSARRGVVARFCLTFPGILIVFSGLYRLDEVVWNGMATTAFTTVAASVVALAVVLMGGDATSAGSTIYYGRSAYRLIPECTGIEVIVVFAAAVLAFPTGGWQRAACLARWIPGLLAINVVRVVTLMALGARMPTAFAYGHKYVWPAIILTIALGAWLSWADRVTDGSRVPG